MVKFDKKDFTGSVSHINTDKLATESTANMTDMLRGTAPGLNVAYTTSAKGLSSAKDIVVRGNTSLRPWIAMALITLKRMPMPRWWCWMG